MLDGYVEPAKYEIFETCAELLRHVNPAVQQDIEDMLIREGITPKFAKRHCEEAKLATAYLNKL